MPGRRDRQRVPPAVSAEVIERWGNDCWLGMPGCTNHSDTTDHIVAHRAGEPSPRVQALQLASGRPDA